jgi:hypothetical protein
VITDVVTAESGEGEVLACEGPQNDDDATILDCLQPQRGVEAVDLDGVAAAAHVPTGGPSPLSAAVVGLFALVGLAVGRGGRLGPRRRRAAVDPSGILAAGG